MKYDVAIIGGGPAGLTAGLFTCNAGLKTICFEKLAVGGQASLSHAIANYPGFENISGFDLTQKFLEHSTQAGLEMEYDKVEKVSKLKLGFKIKTKHNNFECKKLIIATGTKTLKLGVDNESEFVGKGVSYCASCDGMFFKNKTVAIVGGGDSAVQYVEYMSNLAKKVYMLNRSEKFRAKQYKIENLKKYKNVEIITSVVVKALIGNEVLDSIDVEINGKSKNIKLDGIFIAIGHVPDLDFLDFEVEKDLSGFIKVDENQQTSVTKVFACGDIVSKNFKQVITACADGARAGNACIGG